MHIYGLFSTKDSIIRYVGKTKNSLRQRLKEHLNGALKYGVDTYKDRWIRKCYKDGYEVNIIPIEVVNANNINDREIFWIQQFPNLTNTTKGGDGGKLLVYNKTYKECKEWLQTNAKHITSKSLYTKACQNGEMPSFMPISASEHFKSTDEWVSWGDFLSTGKVQDNAKALKYLSYKDAKKHLKPLRLLTKTQYKEYIDHNHIDFLPKRPERFYQKQGWEGYGLFLGFKKHYNITEELITRYLNVFFKDVNTLYKYEKASNKFNNAIPKSPITFNKLYPNFDWTKINKRMIENYKDAEKIVKTFNAKNHLEYERIVKDKYNGILPLQPFLKYKNKGWRNWMTFLGNTNIKHKCDITLDVFRKYMRLYHPNINSAKKYREFYVKNKDKLPKRLPSRPDIVYSMCFSDIFMVHKKRTVPICGFDQFISIMREKHTNITGLKQYKQIVRNEGLEPELPRCPEYQYKMKWSEIIKIIQNKNQYICY